MKWTIGILSLVLGCAALLNAQNSHSPTKEQAASIDFAKQAAVRAMNFRQGDLHSLTDSQVNFTPDGWKGFIARMAGFLDDDGAPTFTSTFVPAGKSVIVPDGEAGSIHLKIPGVLTQTHDDSNTTYRHAALDVKAGGTPIKIEHLEQVFMAR